MATATRCRRVLFERAVEVDLTVDECNGILLIELLMP